MAINSEMREVFPGDGIAIAPNARHQIRNVGDTDLVFLCCCVPAYADDDTLFCEDLLP